MNKQILEVVPHQKLKQNTWLCLLNVQKAWSTALWRVEFCLWCDYKVSLPFRLHSPWLWAFRVNIFKNITASKEYILFWMLGNDEQLFFVSCYIITFLFYPYLLHCYEKNLKHKNKLQLQMWMLLWEKPSLSAYT